MRLLRRRAPDAQRAPTARFEGCPCRCSASTSCGPTERRVATGGTRAAAACWSVLSPVLGWRSCKRRRTTPWVRSYRALGALAHGGLVEALGTGALPGPRPGHARGTTRGEPEQAWGTSRDRCGGHARQSGGEDGSPFARRPSVCSLAGLPLPSTEADADPDYRETWRARTSTLGGEGRERPQATGRRGCGPHPSRCAAAGRWSRCSGRSSRHDRGTSRWRVRYRRGRPPP